MKNYRMPDPGEGLTEAELVSWRVAEGDTVAINDVLCEVETAKSIVELPSPFAGVVARLLVSEGDTVAVGAPLVSVDQGDGPAKEPELLVGHIPAEEGDDVVAAAPRRADRTRPPSPLQNLLRLPHRLPLLLSPLLRRSLLPRRLPSPPPKQLPPAVAPRRAVRLPSLPGSTAARDRPMSWPSPRPADSPRTSTSTWPMSPEPDRTASSPAPTSSRPPMRAAPAGRPAPPAPTSSAPRLASSRCPRPSADCWTATPPMPRGPSTGCGSRGCARSPQWP